MIFQKYSISFGKILIINKNEIVLNENSCSSCDPNNFIKLSECLNI